MTFLFLVKNGCADVHYSASQIKVGLENYKCLSLTQVFKKNADNIGNMKWIFVSARCAFIFTVAISLNLFANSEWYEFYSNTRSLGMGGCSVAVSSDETALYRNPANLGSIRDIYGTFFDPELEGSSNFVRQITSSSIDKAFSLQEISNVLNTNRNTYYHAKIQGSPSLVRRNIGIGLIYKNEVSSEMEATGTTTDTHYQNDLGIVLGSNLRLFDGRIKIGASLRAFNRIEVVNPLLPAAGPFDLATIGSEGTALAVDAGLLIQIPWILLPTFGAVVRDVGNTSFDKQDGFRLRTTSRPIPIKQSVDVAIAMFPIHSNNARSVWTFEYSDVTNSRIDTDNLKRAHFGIEFNTRDIFFFRMGYNQRYWTAGFEIASERLQWQVSSYGEEIGTQAAPREDRRLNTKISVRF